MLIQFDQCFEMLENFGFPVSRESQQLPQFHIFSHPAAATVSYIFSPSSCRSFIYFLTQQLPQFHIFLTLFFLTMDTFVIPCLGTSPHSIISSLCAAALALMNQQAPPLPPTIGAIFAVNIAHRACAQLQAFIRRNHVPMHLAVRMNATVGALAPSTPMVALKIRAAASADDIADSQRPAFVTAVNDSLLATQNPIFDMRSSLLAPD
jgi:hypothetical protein